MLYLIKDSVGRLKFEYAAQHINVGPPGIALIELLLVSHRPTEPVLDHFVRRVRSAQGYQTRHQENGVPRQRVSPSTPGAHRSCSENTLANHFTPQLYRHSAVIFRLVEDRLRDPEGSHGRSQSFPGVTSADAKGLRRRRQKEGVQYQHMLSTLALISTSRSQTATSRQYSQPSGQPHGNSALPLGKFHPLATSLAPFAQHVGSSTLQATVPADALQLTSLFRYRCQRIV